MLTHYLHRSSNYTMNSDTVAEQVVSFVDSTPSASQIPTTPDQLVIDETLPPTTSLITTQDLTIHESEPVYNEQRLSVQTAENSETNSPGSPRELEIKKLVVGMYEDEDSEGSVIFKGSNETKGRIEASTLRVQRENELENQIILVMLMNVSLDVLVIENETQST
jgi:hypothetical protein